MRLATVWRQSPLVRDALWVGLVALLVRLALCVWASGRFPPAEDGAYYHVVAERIAQGFGYTWLWPDGAVTYAAHYPVGYPALVGGVYALFGAQPIAAMLVNALLGTAGAVAAQRLAASCSTRGPALLAGLAVALHPGLVAYTAALMTEGVTAALLALMGWVCWAASRATGRRKWASLLGLVLLSGMTTLVRPQMLLLAPVLGAFAAGVQARWIPRGLSAAVVTAGTLLVCLPWTLRNCDKMDHCVFVSANAGWNLLIGTAPEGHGSWIALDRVGVPQECRTVFAEADKDLCFRAAAVRRITNAPLAWFALVPEKLGATFNASTGPGYYLESSNHQAFSSSAKLALNALQTVFDRVLLLLALVAAARWPGPRRKLRWGLACGAGGLLLTPWAWPAFLGLAAVVALLGRSLARALPLGLAAASLAATAVIHATFFGAGRYAMACVAVLAVLVGPALSRRRDPEAGDA